MRQGPRIGTIAASSAMFSLVSYFLVLCLVSLLVSCSPSSRLPGAYLPLLRVAASVQQLSAPPEHVPGMFFLVNSSISDRCASLVLFHFMPVVPQRVLYLLIITVFISCLPAPDVHYCPSSPHACGKTFHGIFHGVTPNPPQTSTAYHGTLTLTPTLTLSFRTAVPLWGQTT